MANSALPDPSVLPTSDARRLLTSITASFREHGAAAGPVIYGTRFSLAEVASGLGISLD